MNEYKKPKGIRFIRALIKHGYEIKNYCKGSHVFIIHPQNKDSYAVVPNTRKALKIGLLEGVRKSLKLSRTQFFKILEDC